MDVFYDPTTEGAEGVMMAICHCFPLQPITKQDEMEMSASANTTTTGVEPPVACEKGPQRRQCSVGGAKLLEAKTSAQVPISVSLPWQLRVRRARPSKRHA